MPGVELLIHKLIDVHEAVEEILPCVDEEPARKEDTYERTSETVQGREKATYMEARNCTVGIAHQYTKYTASPSISCTSCSPTTRLRTGPILCAMTCIFSP